MKILLKQNLSSKKQVVITGDEFHYMKRVRRKRVGDKITIQAEDGAIFDGLIACFNNDNAIVDLGVSENSAVKAHNVRIISAIPKGRILDGVVRNLNEMGVLSFTPVICKRTVTRPGTSKVERWRRIAEESVRQCGREYPLIIEEEKNLKNAIDEADEDTLLIMHPSGDSSAGELLRSEKKGSVAILIGPEGGFTDDEVEYAVSKGFSSFVSGKTIYKIETAILVAAVVAIGSIGGLD